MQTITSLIMNQIESVEDCKDVLGKPVKKIILYNERFPNMKTIVHLSKEVMEQLAAHPGISLLS